MAKDFIPSISVEKMAAYLDSNLPKEEMQSIQLLIEGNEDLGDLLGEVSVINNDLEEISLSQNSLELDLPDSWLLPNPADSLAEIDFSVMEDLFFYDSIFIDDNPEDFSMNSQNMEEY